MILAHDSHGRGRARLGEARLRKARLRKAGWELVVLPLCLLFAPLSVPPAVAAQQVRPQHYAPPVGGISLEQAADKVRRKTGGRVLSATPVEKGGRRGYSVRVLLDGKRVKQYYVDADGRMSSR